MPQSGKKDEGGSGDRVRFQETIAKAVQGQKGLPSYSAARGGTRRKTRLDRVKGKPYVQRQPPIHGGDYLLVEKDVEKPLPTEKRATKDIKSCRYAGRPGEKIQGETSTD